MTTLPLTDILAQLDRWYAEHAPAIHATLRPGATDAQLDALEGHIGLKLPQDFRELYKWHDGDDSLLNGAFSLEFATLSNIVAYWDVWLPIYDDYVPSDDIEASISQEFIAQQEINKAWVPFLHDGAGNFVALDLAPGTRGHMGQIITFGPDEPVKYVLASSLADFLAEYLQRLQKGQAMVSEDGSGIWNIHLKDSAGTYKKDIGSLADIYPGFGASPAVRER